MPTRDRRAKQLGVPVDELPDGRGRHGAHSRGRRHHRWNAKRILSSHGYVKVRVGRDHPLADGNGYAYEHLMVWVSAGRARPGDNQVIHHQNEDKTDNRLANLHLLTRAEHAEHHADERARDVAGRWLRRVITERRAAA